MNLRRGTMFCVLASVLGAATSLAIALGVAGWRAPTNTFGPSIMTAVEARPDAYRVAGSTPESSHVGWFFSDNPSLGSRTFNVMSALTSDAAYQTLPRPRTLSAEMDIFLDRTWMKSDDTHLRGGNAEVVAYAYGWPATCLWYGRVVNGPIPLTESHWSMQGYGAARPASALRMSHPLPSRPIWSGLLIDTSVFALIWAAALLVPDMLRQSLRRRSHRCLRCGYHLAGLSANAPCPECGTSQTSSVQ